MVVHGGGTSRQCSADLGSSLVFRRLRLRGGATPQMTPEYAEFLKKENDPAVSKWEAEKQASASARWEFGADQWREMGYYEQSYWVFAAVPRCLSTHAFSTTAQL